MLHKPYPNEYDPKLETYIAESQDEELSVMLDSENILNFFKGIPVNKYDYRYQEGKWSIKEIISHIIDAERIFSFRALWIARNIQASLPGYDENLAAHYSNANLRSYDDLLEEYRAARLSTKCLFRSFDAEMLRRKGDFDNKFATVKSLGYIILGHEAHHIKVIKEKYL